MHKFVNNNYYIHLEPNYNKYIIGSILVVMTNALKIRYKIEDMAEMNLRMRFLLMIELIAWYLGKSLCESLAVNCIKLS